MIILQLLKRKPRHPDDDIEVKIIDFGLSKVKLHFGGKIAQMFMQANDTL
jgi:hypothetical protein